MVLGQGFCADSTVTPPTNVRISATRFILPPFRAPHATAGPMPSRLGLRAVLLMGGRHRTLDDRIAPAAVAMRIVFYRPDDHRRRTGVGSRGGTYREATRSSGVANTPRAPGVSARMRAADVATDYHDSRSRALR
jgi:hypothetical protein